MSKRFGRNQRRQLKARLAVAEDKVAALSHLSVRNAELRATIEEIERMANRFSLLAPPPTVTNATDPFRVTSTNLLSDEKLIFTTLNAVCSAVEVDQNGRIHALLQHPNGRVRYALSDDALHFMTKGELIAMMTRYVLPDMVRELADQMKGKR